MDEASKAATKTGNYNRFSCSKAFLRCALELTLISLYNIQTQVRSMCYGNLNNGGVNRPVSVYILVG